MHINNIFTYQLKTKTSLILFKYKEENKMGSSELGKLIMFIGALLLVVGLLIYVFGLKLSWFGNLPGDIQYESKNIKIYIPIVSMIIISVIISVLIRIYKFLF